MNTMKSCQDVKTEPYMPSDIEKEHDILVNLNTVKTKAKMMLLIVIHSNLFSIA